MLTLEKELKCAEDPIFLTTNNTKTDETKHQQEHSQKKNRDRHFTNGNKFNVSECINLAS